MSPAADLVFREATRADLPAIVDMLSDDVLGSMRGEDAGDALGECYFRAFAEISADPNNFLFVAQRASGVVGCFQLTFVAGLTYRGARRSIVEGVRVAAAERGRGTGRAMIRHAIETSRAGGARIVQLTTDKRRIDAHRFYASLGFVASHEGFKLEL